MANPGFSSRPIYGDEPSDQEPQNAAPGGPIRQPIRVRVPRQAQPTVRRHRERGAAAVSGFAGWWKRHVWKPRTRREWKMLVLKVVSGGAVIIVVTLGLLWITLPNIDDPTTLFASQSTVILDRNGVELYRLFSEQDRTYIPGTQISNYVKQATISIEDERFFSRGSCFDFIGFTRALLSQALPGALVRSGGSTLTQQFAGNAMVGRERSLLRKVRELMLACKLEQKYDKDQLLELYLNWIPYGQNAYGVEQAARNYFGTGASSVTLAQAATLASLPQRPSYFTPYGSHVRTQVSDQILQGILQGEITSSAQIPDAGVRIGLIGQEVGSGATKVYVGGRADQVLKNMLEQKMISEEEHAKAVAELKKMTFRPERENIRAPHFVLSVQKQVQDLLGIDEKLLQQGGFRITTTLDWNLQQVAEKAVADHSEDVVKRFGARNSALLSLSTKTREVLAYVGNTDYGDEEHEGKIDMVRSPRQPGSSFKAFTYLSAFEQGYTPGTVIYDLPTKFGDDEPQNFDGTFWGLTTIRQAFAGSRNIPAVKAFFLGGGEDALLSLASRLGVTTPLEQKEELMKDNKDYAYGWPLAIGAAEVPLWEMVQGYATIADGGKFTPPVTILKITDGAGNIRYANKPTPPQDVVDARVAAMVTSVLSDVSARPNEYWQGILSVPGVQAAAKTGTSNKCLERDSKGGCTLRRPESVWTLGYSPNIVTGVWVGNATSQSLFEKADGLTTAAPIWQQYMIGAHKKLTNVVSEFTLPPKITQPLLSKLSGQLADACTPVELRKADLSLEERTPTQEDSACVLLKVDKVTGLLASPACPADAVEERAFFVPESEQPTRWPLWEQAVQEWAKDEMVKWNANETHSGSHLPLALPPTAECDPALTPGRLEKPSVQLLTPSGGSSVTYPSFRPKVKIVSRAELKEVRYFVDDKQVAVFSEAPFDGPVRVPRSVQSAGSHTMKVVVTDKYFNTAQDTSSFIFEDDADRPRVRFEPDVESVSLPGGAELNLNVDAQDAGGIDRVEFYMDGQLLTVKRTEPYQLQYTLKEAAGPHVIRAVARDTAGNEGDAELTVNVGF
ncbi:MAG TPA: transglycosylase domain-containing protein [Candidatus Peribacteria bacterium]|nr:transglycosylase domain-containing protein [Candidatus Peribacteria bacterium]